MKQKTFRVTLGVLLFLLAATYIGRTLYQLSLPHVVLGFPTTETFTWVYRLEGALTHTEEYKGYTATAEFLLPREELPRDNVAWLGDTMDLELLGTWEAQFPGEIVDAHLEEEGLRITVACTPAYQDFVKGKPPLKTADGDSVNATYTKETETYKAVVPISAVQPGSPIETVWTVSQEDGFWGKEYVVSALITGLAEVKDGMAALAVMEDYTRPIVFYSNEPLQEGGRVRIYP